MLQSLPSLLKQKSKSILRYLSTIFVVFAFMWGTPGCADPEDLDGDGYTKAEGDCNDDDAQIHPNAKEVPGDLIDQNCNGNDDEDVDGDGFSKDGSLGGTPDCDDRNANVYPGRPEYPDGIDQDCDGVIDDETDLNDDDGDGYAESEGDCNDQDPSIHPGSVELLDGVDNNCDGKVDEGTSAHDDDGDGWSEDDGDCDDTDPTKHPGAIEVVNGFDDDCNTLIDDGTNVYDDDGDGYSEAQGDCNDANAAIHPGAVEIEDGLDNNCNGQTDEGTLSYDDDGDGWTESQGDCDDMNAFVFPSAPEFVDGVDNNCDGTVDEGTSAHDDDGDGFSEDGSVGGFRDCNDADSTIHPLADEVYTDLIDSDCDGVLETSPTQEPWKHAGDDAPGSESAAGGLSTINCQIYSNITDPAKVHLPNTVQRYRLHFYDIPNVAGDGLFQVNNLGQPMIPDNIMAMVSGLNARFAPMNLQFEIGTTTSSAVLATLATQEADFDAPNLLYCASWLGSDNPCEDGKVWHGDLQVPIFVVPQLVSYQKQGSSHVACASDADCSAPHQCNSGECKLSWGGRALFPWPTSDNPNPEHAVIVARNSLHNANLVAHELGHFFGLLHTHQGLRESNSGGEVVCRPGTLTCAANCATAGDMLCDTDADPGPQYTTNDSLFCVDAVAGGICSITCAPPTDANGDAYHPNPLNLMSYYTGCAGQMSFSGEQLSRMACFLGESGYFENYIADVPSGAIAVVPFSVPCNGAIHPTTATNIPVGAKHVVIPIVTRYGFSDNDEFYHLSWTLGSSVFTGYAWCSSASALQGYFVVLGLPAEAEVLETPFVLSTSGGTCGTLDAYLPLLSTGHPTVLHLAATTSVVPANDDDMSYQLSLEPEGAAMHLRGRMNANPSAWLAGRVYQIGLPVGFSVTDVPLTANEACTTQAEGSQVIALTKGTTGQGVAFLPVMNFITESAAERGGISTCDFSSPVSVCDGNTGDWHGFDISGDPLLQPSTVAASFTVSASGNKSEASIGIHAQLLEVPSQ